MVSSDFLDDVARAFASMIRRDLVSIVESAWDGQAFGNAVVTLGGRNFRLRLVRDRSQVIAEVACSDRPNDWSSLQRMLQLVLGSGAPFEGVLTTDEVATMLEKYYLQLQDVCSSANVSTTRAKLGEIESQAMKTFMERAKS
jgi:hypothetical protein